MTFEDDLKAECEAERPTADVDVLLNGNPYTLRFTQMEGMDWASNSDLAPARPGVLLDTRYGYHLRQLVTIVAPQCGGRVDGDMVVPLTEDQWRAIFKGNGRNVARIGDAIFMLNEYNPDKAVEDAKVA
ncbi:hypothetical protein [Leifsonia sp. Le1]|uniref:hypothetical protein n=1 Tax=Leifsonia sp. Le1 TaxID=3404918 RepID=UPI003EBF48AF